MFCVIKESLSQVANQKVMVIANHVLLWHYYSEIILESAANELFVGFSKNAEPHHYQGSSLKLFISTPELDPVRFTVVARGFHFNGLATSNSTTEVNLPYTFQVRSNEQYKGIHIKAEGENKLNVYGYNGNSAESSDAFLALPCSNLAVNDYEYYGITYPEERSSFTSDILIVGCENNTVVTTPSSTIVLNQFETYIYSTSDSTGMRITSTKPVAFFSNQNCVDIPSSSGPCDHLTEQIPPTSTWGSSFFVASLMSTTSEDIIRIIAAKNSTTINVNCTTFTQVRVYSLLDAGNWTELMIPPHSFCNIESSAPIFIAQFAVGPTTLTESDPFMMMIPPVEQYSNNYVFNSISGYTNYITLYVASKYYQPGRIFIDATSQINSVWTTLYCFNSSDICGYITRVSLPAGDHRVFHQDVNASVGASVYGFKPFDSYGYPAGLKLAQSERIFCMLARYWTYYMYV